jgi:hypothetical protein
MKMQNYYLNIFNITETQLRQLVSKALSRGGDFADLYFEHTTFCNLNLKDGVVSSGGFHTDYGVGIRVLKGEKTGYAYSENPEFAEMLKAAEAASAIAEAGGRSLSYQVVPDRKLDLYPMKDNWRDMEASIFLPFLKELERQILANAIVLAVAAFVPSNPPSPTRKHIAEATAITKPSVRILKINGFVRIDSFIGRGFSFITSFV